MFKVAIFVALACVSYARAQQAPNALTVRFEAPVVEHFKSPAFISVPLNTTSATNFKALEGNCVNEYANGIKFYGYRYQEADESVMVTLYDTQGTVAGIQACWPKSMLTADNDLDIYNISSYQVITSKAGDTLVCQTAYFVDPKTICNGGRSMGDLKTQGTAPQLQFQWGATPEVTKIVPLKRADAAAQKWSTNNCFMRMGYHNFYDVESYSDSNCRRLHGYFGLYDSADDIKKQNNIGFGFRFEGESKSKYTEKPSSGAVKIIQGCAPKCIIDRTDKFGTATMHVYFVAKPQDISCGFGETAGNIWNAKVVENSHDCAKQ